MVPAATQPDRDGQVSLLVREMSSFAAFGRATEVERVASDAAVPVFRNEFWTARQRQGHSLHEISYRACFKPELPAFFLERLTRPGDIVLDPFLGRGTTPLEAALRGRIPWAADINPLSRILLLPRLDPPTVAAASERLRRVDLRAGDFAEELLVFFHESTLRRLQGLRAYFLERGDRMDHVDRWLRMVTINRLTGHSSGFLSVYTLPPNQAVSIESQRKINLKRAQTPPARDVDAILLRKTRSLLRSLTAGERETLRRVTVDSRILVADARHLDALPDAKVSLSVTSPPFLDVVDYARDNWLRCWLAGIDPAAVPITMTRNLATWRQAMTAALAECLRVTRPGGWLAFEVGEIRGGTLRLEDHVLPCGLAAGWEPVLVLIHAQRFTKTSNCWGIANNDRGTNSNRIVLFRKPFGG